MLGEDSEAKLTSSGVAKSGLEPSYTKILLPIKKKGRFLKPKRVTLGGISLPVYLQLKE